MKDFLRAKAAHIRLGAAGERAAVRMLENAGCDILARDCRMRSGEIDIVARDGLCLVFVEVKTRRLRKDVALSPGTNLRTAQKRRIYRAALAYMKKIGSPQVPYRFDLVEVDFSRFGLFSMHHRKASFGRRSMERKHGKSGTAPINYFD